MACPLRLGELANITTLGGSLFPGNLKKKLGEYYACDLKELDEGQTWNISAWVSEG